MFKKIVAIAAVLWGLHQPLYADEITFPAGSLVIPMDKQTQNLTDDGIFLAYGLIYQLLGQGYTVYTAINPAKTSNEEADIDLADKDDDITDLVEVVNGEAYMPMTLAEIETFYEATNEDPLIYKGGPFIIHKDEATAVLDAITQLGGFDAVVVHRFKTSVGIPVGATYDEVPKKIALLESANGSDDYTTDVMVCYMDLAGIPTENYDILTQDDVISGDLVVGTYYILWIPHWTLSDQADTNKAEQTVTKIVEFLDAGGNVLATCTSIDSLSAVNPLHVDNNLGVNSTTLTGDVTYEHHEIPFAQIGDYQFEVDPVDTQNYRAWQVGDTAALGHTVPLTSSWATNTKRVAHQDDLLGGEWAFYSLRVKDDDENKGNIHYIAGHQYASCKPTIQPGVVYRMAITMSDCDGSPKNAFWDNPNPCMRITLEYATGDQSISIELCDGDFKTSVGNEFMLWTEDPSADPDRFGTNYGPGCRGGGSPRGTDHLDGVFIQNLTTDSNIIIKNIKVEWSCDNFSSADDGCSDSYQFEQFDIKIDNGNCGNSSCTQCTNVYGGSKTCQPDGDFSFVPSAKSNSDLAFDGGLVGGSEGTTIGNVGGLRYIYNTLFNKIVNPIQVAEFARSGPIVKTLTLGVDENGDAIERTYVFAGTFEYPDNAGHFRAYETTDSSSGLSLLWDAADNVPAFNERNLFTYINVNGTWTKYDMDVANAQTFLDYVNDSTLTLADMEENIRSFRGKYRFKRMGGIENSTAALVNRNNRFDTRTQIAYVGTTYGALEMIDISDGSEYGGYVPAGVLHNLKFTDTADNNRPKVDSSPSVADVFMRKADDTLEREWKTILIHAHGSNATGFSVLDVTDPATFKVLWAKFEDNDHSTAGVYGNTHRVSIARYSTDVTIDSVTTTASAYMAVVSSNYPDDDANTGLIVSAYDLRTGTLLWSKRFQHPTPVDNQNDIPAAVSIADIDNNRLDDYIFIGDMAGRLYRMPIQATEPTATQVDETLTGSLPSSPFQEARPIGATPAVGKFFDDYVVAYGTGGTNWSNATNNLVKVLSVTDGSEILSIDIGERRIYSPILITPNAIFFTAVSGTLGSADPTLDIAADDDPDTLQYGVTYIDDGNGGKTLKTKSEAISKTESHSYIEGGQRYNFSFDDPTLERKDARSTTTATDNPSQAFSLSNWQEVTNDKAYEDSQAEEEQVTPPR